MSEQTFRRSRRDLIRFALAAGTAVSLPALAAEQGRLSAGPEIGAGAAAASALKGTKVILLGTKGGPTPSALRAPPANLVLINGQPYVVDCGNGVAVQLIKAGIELPKIRDIFLTHHHSDHNADMGNLVLLAWASGLRTPVHLYGPPPLKKMMDNFLDMNAIDIEGRIREEGRPPLRPLISLSDFDSPRLVMENDQVRVSATVVNHYTIKPSFAYRFDAKDRSVVFSGDTTYDENLIKLAKGADVLVHEVMYLPAIEELVKTGDIGPKLHEHLLKSHTTTAQVGRVAAAAAVKTLVLSHLVPGADPTLTDEMWSSEPRQYFHGEIIVGRDLMVI